jgi:excisionase family DNA binding protein
MMGKQPAELLTVRESAEILHVHPSTIRQWGNKGILKVWRITPRGDRRFSKDDILKVLDEIRIHSDEINK